MSDKIIIKIGQGDEAREYPLDLARVLNAEAMLAERVTRLTWDEVKYGLAAPVSITSATVLLWIVRKRQEPGLKFDDVQFAIEDLHLIDPDELEPEALPPVASDEDEVPKDDPTPPEPSSEPSTGSL